MSAKLQRMSWCRHCGQGLWDWSRKPKLYCSKSCWWEENGRHQAGERSRRLRRDPEYLEWERLRQATPENNERNRQRRQARTTEEWEAERSRDRARYPILLAQARERRVREAERPERVAERIAAEEDRILQKALAEAIREVLKPPPPQDRACGMCGERFTLTRANQRYCSPPCALEANRDHARARAQSLAKLNPGPFVARQQAWKAEAAGLRDRARDLREHGWSVTAIARGLNRSPKTIRDYLTSPAHWRRDAGTMAS